MREDLRFLEAAHRAEEVIRQFGVTSLPIDPFAIAAKNDITVQPKASSEPGVSGFLLKVGNRFGIAYAVHIRNLGFIRFTVAHELGHYFLGHVEGLFAGGQPVHASHSGFISDDPRELEADHFAASLLMPQALFVPALRTAGVGFPAIRHLADTCETSLTATAIRFARFAEDPVVVVVSTGQRVDYSFFSEAIEHIPGLRWLPKGARVPAGTTTARFNGDQGNISDGRHEEGSTTLDRWIDSAPEVEMNEDVVGLGSYGKTLTVLFTEEPIEEDDESDGEGEESDGD